MRTPGDPAAEIRFEARDKDWLIATVNGTRIVAAPVPTAEVDSAIDELVAQLGTRTHVQIHHADGSIDRRVVYPRPAQPLSQATSEESETART